VRARRKRRFITPRLWHIEMVELGLVWLSTTVRQRSNPSCDLHGCSSVEAGEVILDAVEGLR
jgi:hypothetical protein